MIRIGSFATEIARDDRLCAAPHPSHTRSTFSADSSQSLVTYRCFIADIATTNNSFRSIGAGVQGGMDNFDRAASSGNF